MDNYKLQDFIFEDKLTRLKLLNYESNFHFEKYKVMVYRNHSFELVVNTIKCFLDYAEIKLDFVYSSYDDSLAFNEIEENVDLVILWLDLERYKTKNINSFLTERIKKLNIIYKKNILFIASDKVKGLDKINIIEFPIEEIKEELKDQFYDERLEKVSGTRFSSKALLKISRELGLKWLPALLKPTLKCLIFDLDNTMYKGVLGEDGVYGVKLDDFHYKLQKKIKELKRQGFFICIASKNDYTDVISLFDNRIDFILEKEDFSVIKASWNSKSKSIQEIASELNIGTDSFLFVDDNLGELNTVKIESPGIKTIWAKENTEITYEALCNFPGLLRLNITLEDQLRIRDIAANSEREKTQKTMCRKNYIKSMKMKLIFFINDFSNIKRISELSNKTNQFIFNYKRYSESEIKQLMHEEKSVVISVSLSDKLSNSGIICVVVLFDTGNEAELKECFVSCRALARGIDDSLILGAITIGMRELGTNNLKINFVKGEKNTPAENYIKSKLSKYLKRSDVFSFRLDKNLLEINIKGGK